MKFICFNAMLRKMDGNSFDNHETWLNPNAVVEITQNEYGGAVVHLVTGEIIELGYSPRIVAEMLCEE